VFNAFFVGWTMENISFDCSYGLCNIPLVSIGVISVEGVPENNVHEIHYDEECIMI
jgi:hypothetical protein